MSEAARILKTYAVDLLLAQERILHLEHELALAVDTITYTEHKLWKFAREVNEMLTEKQLLADSHRISAEKLIEMVRVLIKQLNDRIAHR